MLATPGKLFSAPGWLYELKYDGFRCLVSKQDSVVRLQSRNGRDMSSRFPELIDEIRPMRADFVVDGELVVILDRQGRPEWSRLQRRHVLSNPRRIAQAALSDPAAIFAFDLLSLDGADLRQRPLLDRKAALHRTLPANRRMRYASHIVDGSAEIWAMVNEFDLEGIVAKDAASIYTAGRTLEWQKIKTAVGAERERARRP